MIKAGEKINKGMVNSLLGEYIDLLICDYDKKDAKKQRKTKNAWRKEGIIRDF